MASNPRTYLGTARTGAVLLMVGLAGCALPQLGTNPDNGRTVTIWESLDQYVRLVPREGGPPNDQPVHIPPAQLRAVLSTLAVKRPSREGAQPLLDESEQRQLAQYLSTALDRAGPDQDVTFATYGMHPGIFSLESGVTSGRVFYHDGRLQLIVGDVHRHLKEEEQDRRLHPILPGERARPVEQSWELVTQPGQEYQDVAGRPRYDWLKLDVPTVVAEARPVGEKAEQVQVREDIAQIKEDVSRLKQKSAPAAAAPPVVAAPRPASAAASRGQVIEERLTVLKRLRDKGLISEDEYRAKRRQILDEL